MEQVQENLSPMAALRKELVGLIEELKPMLNVKDGAAAYNRAKGSIQGLQDSIDRIDLQYAGEEKAELIEAHNEGQIHKIGMVTRFMYRDAAEYVAGKYTNLKGTADGITSPLLDTSGL